MHTNTRATVPELWLTTLGKIFILIKYSFLRMDSIKSYFSLLQNRKTLLVQMANLEVTKSALTRCKDII